MVYVDGLSDPDSWTPVPYCHGSDAEPTPAPNTSVGKHTDEESSRPEGRMQRLITRAHASEWMEDWTEL